MPIGYADTCDSIGSSKNNKEEGWQEEEEEEILICHLRGNKMRRGAVIGEVTAKGQRIDMDLIV